MWADGTDLIILYPVLSSNTGVYTRYSNGYSPAAISLNIFHFNLVLFEVKEFYGTTSNFKFGVIFNYQQSFTCNLGETGADTSAATSLTFDNRQIKILTIRANAISIDSGSPATLPLAHSLDPVAFTQPFIKCATVLYYDRSLPQAYPDQSVVGTLTISLDAY